jgi:hypothetical protein
MMGKGGGHDIFHIPEIRALKVVKTDYAGKIRTQF